MKSGPIIWISILAALLMALTYGLLDTIDHRGSNILLVALLIALVADLAVMIRTFLGFMKQR